MNLGQKGNEFLAASKKKKKEKNVTQEGTYPVAAQVSYTPDFWQPLMKEEEEKTQREEGRKEDLERRLLEDIPTHFLGLFLFPCSFKFFFLLVFYD